MGLHQRYNKWLESFNTDAALELSAWHKQELTSKFKTMMRALFKQKGANLEVGILAEAEVQDFINSHASVLDASMEQVRMSDAMRQRLQRSNYIFSGLKTFHELNEAFPSLLDENGNRKPFERFLNDVQKIDATYNEHYLRAEYNFAQSSATMAAKWEEFEQEGDRYYLQYRTAGDNKVRPEHADMHGITLPINDPFWEEFYPPNGWNCRCTVVQVRKSKHPPTDHDEAIALGELATGKDTKGIFRFNPGKQQKTFPDYNPYTIRKCKECDIPKGNMKLDFLPSNLLCDGCRYIHECYDNKAKSESRVLKDHYMHEMEPLLSIKHKMAVGKSRTMINVGFSNIGNEHLYSDTFKRSKVLRKEDLKHLDKLLTQATYIDDQNAHGHKYNIEHFFYYETELRGHKIRLNIAKEVKTYKSGKTRVKYYLYSINDIKK